MLPHLLSHTRRSRRQRTAPAIAIGAILVLAATAACSGSTAAPPPKTAAADAVVLTGAGYAVGSSAGITRFTAGQVNFGATDVPASSTDLAAARGGPALQVPVDLGAVAVAYNAQMLSDSPLKLTGPVLAEIFLGQIAKWNDPAIAALNPGAQLPDTYITVVHRADGSGTTYIFSNYLSEVSPSWATKVGTGRSLHWPVGYGADGNAGVAAAIEHIPGSIGYAETSYTKGTALGYAAIANRDGNYTTPTPAAITVDAAAKPAITPADFSIVNQPGAAAYPISGYSWVLISARQPGQASGQALTGLLSWLTGPGQAYAATLGYVPLPAAIRQLATTTLNQITGPAGQPLTGG